MGGEGKNKAFKELKELLSKTPVFLFLTWISHSLSTVMLVIMLWSCPAARYEYWITQAPANSLLSKKMNSAQCNYTVYEKELLAIVYALVEWKHYLHGSSHRTIIVSDHQPLKWLLTQSSVSARVTRWLDFMGQFHIGITYKPGRENAAADGLSRRSDHDEGVDVRTQQRVKAIKAMLSTIHSSELVCTELVEDIKAAYLKDAQCSALLKEAESNRTLVSPLLNIISL